MNNNQIDELCRLRSDLKTGLYAGSTAWYQARIDNFIKVLDEIIGQPNANSGDCISRAALKKIIEEDQIQWNRNTENDIGRWEQCERILNFIDNLPPVVPVCPYSSDDEVRQPCIEGPCIADHCERPQGEWIFKNGKYRCTACGEKAIYRYSGSLAITQTELLTHFCPNCGADMRGGAE